MNILVINCGSSSLKYQVFRMEDEFVLAKGLAERIGINGSRFKYKPHNGEEVVIEQGCKVGEGNNVTVIGYHCVALENATVEDGAMIYPDTILH